MHIDFINYDNIKNLFKKNHIKNVIIDYEAHNNKILVLTMSDTRQAMIYHVDCQANSVILIKVTDNFYDGKALFERIYNG